MLSHFIGSLMEFISYMLEIVSTVKDDQCHYIDDLLLSLSGVDNFYYSYTTPKGNIKYPERVFAYEVYHQLRDIMQEKTEKYDDVYLNGEQQKSSEVVDDLSKCTPDLILHRRIYDCKQEDQLWLCEIKMKGNPDAMSDLMKFEKMEALNFQCYIFLYAGVLFSEMVDVIGETKIQSNNGTFDKTICISSYNDGENIEIHCHSLKEIYDYYARKKSMV